MGQKFRWSRHLEASLAMPALGSATPSLQNRLSPEWEKENSNNRRLSNEAHTITNIVIQ